jgi:hypothetical protein
MGVNKVVFGAVAIMDISDSTVTPDKLAKGATAYDKSGEKITGTMEAATDPKLQEKTVTPATSAQSVTPDSGYDGLSKVTVNAMPTATQATPSISVSSAGLIAASATQTAGYVAAGTKSATKQLTTQAAKTITPSTSSQTAVAAGRYTTGAVTVAAIPSTYVKPTATKAATTYTPTTSNQTIAAGTYCSGAQTIKGDANLVAGNIKSGVSIFGVAGSYEGSGGGSGGGSVGTCTVNISIVGATGGTHIEHVYYSTIDENGAVVYKSLSLNNTKPTSLTIEAIPNTYLYVSCLRSLGDYFVGRSAPDIDVIDGGSGILGGFVTAPVGETTTIRFMYSSEPMS